MSYSMTKTVGLGYDEAIEKTKEELKKVGFGILTTIDVKATLKEKIDVDFGKYIILGACNPSLAHKALQIETEIGLMLPCNVIIYETESGETVVSIMNPEIISKVVADPDALKEMTDEAQSLLSEALENI